MTSPERLASALAGRYRIERELGRGGMATVYLARDLTQDRPVAIKVLRPELSAILGAQRFAREIRITSELSHPGILPVLDSGEDPAIGLCWYAMPYVEGESLRDRMTRETQLPIDEALQVFGEVAEALDYAHQQGFVHRDLKPENILLQDGHARVADFGIARSVSAAESEKLTETGLALGTPQYMSPEQAAGQGKIDARSDIYALGCVLYEMLAGNPPFQGPTPMAVMARHAVDPVPGLRTVRATVPPPVEAAIAKALAKVPADRFTSAAQFVEAFSKPAPTVGPASRRTRIAWAAGIVVALAAAAGGVLFARSRRPQVIPAASAMAVLPLGTSGDTALTRLSHDLVFALSANLDGQGGIHTADPQRVLSQAKDSRAGQWLPNAVSLGRQLGAGSVVMGSIVAQGANVQVDLKLISTLGDSEPLARVSVIGSPDSIRALTDSITWSLLRQVWRRGDPPSPSYANLTTKSVVALRAFLDGERLSVSGRWQEAANAYAAAVEADSSFWLAGWGYNNTQVWLFDGEGEDVLTQGYEAHRSVFGERDRLLIEADMGLDSITPEAHAARHRAITTRFPNDWPGWLKYADELHHSGATIGYTSAEARAALQRTVDLNPKLVPIWQHLIMASMGHDTAQAARASKALTTLGDYARRSQEQGYDVSLYSRIALSGDGAARSAMLDSLAAGLVATKNPMDRIVGTFTFLIAGLPQAQVELARRFVKLDPGNPFSWAGLAEGWTARGAWDSALAAADHWVAGIPQEAPRVYQKAVSGAWLLGLDTGRAAARRPAVVKYLETQPPNSPSTHMGQLRLAWADGIFAVIRNDAHGLAEARARAQGVGEPQGRFLVRSLAGFELLLAGQKRAAAESLAALDLKDTNGEIDGYGPRDPFARSINHLTASRLLLELGDTTRAIKLLTWHEAMPAASRDPGEFQLFAALAYYQLALIEDAQGNKDAAREHYQQFLRRYDMPPPAHLYMVDEARAALKRLSGLNDTAVAPTR